VATYTTDAQGYLTYFNDAAAELWGRRPILGKDRWSGSYKVFRMDGTPVEFDKCPMAIALKKGKYKSGEEFYIERPDGTRRYMKPSPLVDIDKSGEIIGGVNTLIDITPQILAKQESEQLQQQKDDFLGIASHELKTPITVIKSYAQMLEGLLRDKGNLKEAAMASKMNEQVNKMNSLIVDLLDTTKINAGKLQFNDVEFNFDEMVNGVLDDMANIHSHRLVRKLKAPRIVYADKERIGQVIENFITNAVKYSPSAKKIEISSRVKKNEILFSVQDFGIGIDGKKKNKVFEQFYRVTGKKGEINTFPGIGLGLFISAEIIAREKGKIWVESEKGKGSTFYFSLPCKD
jgi:signal transduction histidine kinase